MGLAAISYDSPEILKEFAARKGITFPLLSDAGSKTIRAYGILNATVKPDSFAYGIPNPGTLVLDRAGKIIAKYAEDDYRERLTVEAILNRQPGPTVAASTGRISGKRMNVSLSASQTVVSSGQRVTLFVEGDLPDKMHVYAPGVTGYKPVVWELAESPAWKPAAVTFPKSEMLHLPAINETVPVFRNRFQMRREVTIGMPADLKSMLDGENNLVVKGILRFQACDDKQCYLPESLPVEWKLRWEPFDSQRSSEGVRHK